MSRTRRVPTGEHYIHINARANNREKFPLPLNEVWEILTDYLFLLNKGFGVEILSFVLMPNHFHLLVRDPNFQLSAGMEYFMRETSREIGRKAGRINKIWGAPYHPTVVTSNLHYYHAYKYIYRNPLEKDLCKRVEDYEHSTLAILLGRRSGIVPLQNDFTLFSDPEGTLKWLNTSYKESQSEQIRKALRKKTFKLALDRKNRNRSELDDWDSVPFLSDGRKNYQK